MFKFAVRKTEEICAAAARAQRPRRRRHRPVRVAPGEPPHHPVGGRAARAADPSKVIINIETLRQHDRGHDPAGAERRGVPGPAEEGRPGAAGVGRRRLHRRRGAAALGILRASSVRFRIRQRDLVTVPRSFCCLPPTAAAARAKQVLSPNARVRARGRGCARCEGAPLGELFAFVSGLYFRGKLTYARRFARRRSRTSDRRQRHPRHHANAGLRAPDTRVTRAAVQAFAGGDIDADECRATAGRSSAARARSPARSAPTASRAARQHRVAEVRRRARRHLRRAAAVSRSTSSAAAT